MTTATTPGTLDLALDYRRQGIAVVPVPLRGKDPGDGARGGYGPGWQNAKLDDADIRRHFATPKNIGQLNGEPSGGRVDIDLDILTATITAPYFLPVCYPCFGRASKPSSHYTVLCSAAKTKKYRHKGAGMVLEVRGTGTQTVLPGSTHESGEAIVWHDPSPPETVDAQTLYAAADRTAAAALLAHYWPSKGTRHDASLALAGGLISAGWNTDDAKRFVEAVCDAGGCLDIAAKVANVADTKEKHDRSEKIFGWTNLDELIGEGVVKSVRNWLAIKSPREKKPKANRSFIMRRGNDIDDAGVNYLWKRRFVNGSINIVFSRPGRGKSTIATDIGAHVTNGKAWPDGSPCKRGTVLYLKGEGSDASLRDRFKLAGADGDKYWIIGRAETDDPDDTPMIDLANDVAPLMRAIEDAPDTKLIVVDTLDSMYPSMRMIDNADIRRCLWPLQELAEQTGICVIILAHTNKGSHMDPLDRLSGGRAIGGAARCVWYLGKLDPHAEETYLAKIKANDFLPGPTLEYTFVSHGPDKPGSIRWGREADDVTAWDLDNPPRREKGEKAEKCEEWLGSLLADGPKKTQFVKEQAKGQDYGDHVLTKARHAMKIEVNAAKGARPTVWFWCLPDQKTPDLTDVGILEKS